MIIESLWRDFPRWAKSEGLMANEDKGDLEIQIARKSSGGVHQWNQRHLRSMAGADSLVVGFVGRCVRPGLQHASNKSSMKARGFVTDGDESMYIPSVTGWKPTLSRIPSSHVRIHFGPGSYP